MFIYWTLLDKVQRSGACKSQPITKTKAIDLSKPHAEDINMIDITVKATTQLAHTYIQRYTRGYIVSVRNKRLVGPETWNMSSLVLKTPILLETPKASQSR